jgi:hypothetical protein
MNMRQIAALIDTLTADFGEGVSTRAVTRVVFDLVADRPDDAAACIEPWLAPGSMRYCGTTPPTNDAPAESVQQRKKLHRERG